MTTDRRSPAWSSCRRWHRNRQRLFVDGTLVLNTELGHLPLHGGDAERYAASSVRSDDSP